MIQKLPCIVINTLTLYLHVRYNELKDLYVDSKNEF